MKSVGDKFKAWYEKQDFSARTCEQAFCSGHVAGAELRHDEVHTLQARLDFTIKALKNIANADYRGNRSPESVSAYNALRQLEGGDLSGQGRTGVSNE